MTTEVQTKTRCDRCEASHLRSGAERGVPPVGWGKLSLSVRQKGEGWTNKDGWEWELCPRCIREIKDEIRSGGGVE